MNNDDIGHKLDAIAAILKLVHYEQLDAARKRIRADKIYDTILDSTKDWTAAAKVQAAATKKGRRTEHDLEEDRRADRAWPPGEEGRRQRDRVQDDGPDLTWPQTGRSRRRC